MNALPSPDGGATCGTCVCNDGYIPAAEAEAPQPGASGCVLPPPTCPEHSNPVTSQLGGIEGCQCDDEGGYYTSLGETTCKVRHPPPSPPPPQLPAEVAATLMSCIGDEADPHNVGKNSQKVLELFNFLKEVCCDEFGETCTKDILIPTTCNTKGCARVVSLVAESCAFAFQDNAFMQMSFGGQLFTLTENCAAQPKTAGDMSLSYVITDPTYTQTPMTTQRPIESCTGARTRNNNDSSLLPSPLLVPSFPRFLLPFALF